MTASLADAAVDGRAPARVLERLRTPGVLVNLAGVLLVGTGVLATRAGLAAAVLPLGVAALAGWTVWTLLGRGRARDVALVVGGLAAAVGAGLGLSVLIAVVIAAIVLVVSDLRRPAASAAGFVTVLTLAVAVAAAAARTDPGTALSTGAGIVIAVLAAVTRRQNRSAAAREQELQRQAVETEREADRARLLADRAAVARDIHDVLAHSLGGLVLQLDAIEALLEHGRVEEATTRTAQAHRLATEGLAEARRAVAALREPGAVPSEPAGALAALVATHRALGAEAHVEGDLELAPLDDAHRTALFRALQEALSNARRHAPGATTRIRAVRDGGLLALTVSTPLLATHAAAAPAAAPLTGGGHGLLGMRERFAALGDASTVTAGASGDAFVVTARVVLR